MTKVRSLVLVGAGGFARETASLVHAINEAHPTYLLLGFVDDDPALAGTCRSGHPVLGPLDWVHQHRDVAVAVCIGSPRHPGSRADVVARLGLDDHRYATLVHPSAQIGQSVKVGLGTVIHAGTVCTADVSVGRHVEIMPQVTLTHDDAVADYATFGAGVRLAGGVSIGRAAYLGSGACIREQLNVGPSSVVGMGSVVLDDVPAGQVWAGNPARFIRSIDDGRSAGTAGRLRVGAA